VRIRMYLQIQMQIHVDIGEGCTQSSAEE